MGGASGAGATEPAIEATLHKRIDGSHWRAFVKPAKKLEVGDVLRFGTREKSVSSANLMLKFHRKMREAR